MLPSATDVFVSYKAEDRRRVKPLVEALEADGNSVWWDAEIGGGAAWRHEIEAELNAAKCVIVVWSKRSVSPEGEFVQDEATRAKLRHVYVPVLIDKVQPPLGFGETQALSLTGWHGSRSDPKYQAVLAAVQRNVGGEKKPAAPLLPHTHVDRRAIIAGGAVAAVAAAGVGGWVLLRPSSASAAGSIAVLPFANLSGDPNQTYFSDGVAEEIRSALARIAGLRVVGRTSSEAVRNDDAETAAKKLGVANILTGSVRQSPSTIRIGAELIDGRTGIDRWSQNYDRAPGDAIKIQTDIAENVASALSAALGIAARTAISIGGTANAAAQNLYLRARAQILTDDSEAGVTGALQLLDSAIALDPNFARAYAQKAQDMNQLTGYFQVKGGRFEPGLADAERVARHAISLAPSLSAGHLALSKIFLSQLDIRGAETELHESFSLAPGDVDNLLEYGRLQGLVGNAESAVELARQAQVRDPLNPAAYSREGYAMMDGRRFAEAVASYRKALSIAPKRLIDRAWLSIALMQLGRLDEATAEIRKLPQDNFFRLVGEAIIAARKGDLPASNVALQRAVQISGDAGSYQYADIYAQRGDKERAFAALDRAWTLRDPGLSLLKTDSFLDSLRSDPRFGELLKKMDFP